MVKSEYTVIGNWAVSHDNGFVRHKVCNRWCHSYNNGDSVFHRCGSAIYEDEERDYDIYGKTLHLEIPGFVMLISEALRRN